MLFWKGVLQRLACSNLIRILSLGKTICRYHLKGENLLNIRLSIVVSSEQAKSMFVYKAYSNVKDDILVYF